MNIKYMMVAGREAICGPHVPKRNFAKQEKVAVPI